MSNGQKAAAVALMGAVSLLGLIALAIVDLVKGSGDGHSSSLMASAFTFLTVQAGGAMTYLMGASTPDQLSGREPLAPGETRVAVTSEASAAAPTTVDDLATIVTK
jgi:hypothetical protein